MGFLLEGDGRPGRDNVRPHRAAHKEGEDHWRKQGQQEALGLGWIAALLVRVCPKPGMGSGPER